VGLDVCEDAEVDQREPRGSAALRLRDRPLPGFEVDLGRRTGRQHEAPRLDPYAGRVTGVQGAVVVQVRDVMPRVSGCRKRFEPEHAVADDVNVRLRNRHELAIEPVQAVSVEAASAGLEPGRVDQVRGADLRDVHLQIWVLAHEHAGCARMIEMDVREDQVADVGQGESTLCQTLLEPLGARRGAAIEQGRAIVRLDDVGADRALVAGVEEIDRSAEHPDDRTGQDRREALPSGDVEIASETRVVLAGVRSDAARLWELDVARTVAIGMMVAFHAAYDVDMLAPDLGVQPRDGGLKVLQVATGSLFLFLVGVSFAVSTARALERGLRGRRLLVKQLRRAGEVGAAALLISLVTFVVFDERWVRFGILHLIAMALGLAPLAWRLGSWNVVAATVVLLAGLRIGEATSDVPGALLLGLRPEHGSAGIDYYPLLPWLAAVLVGIAVGQRLYPQGRRGAWGQLLPRVPERAAALLGAPGRHSLIVYLLHQPVLFPLVAAALFALGVQIE
jgi:uncharacterized membrane protein